MRAAWVFDQPSSTSHRALGLEAYRLDQVSMIKCGTHHSLFRNDGGPEDKPILCLNNQGGTLTERLGPGKSQL